MTGDPTTTHLMPIADRYEHKMGQEAPGGPGAAPQVGDIIQTDRGPRIVVDDWQPIETAQPWRWPAHTYIQGIQQNAAGAWMAPWSVRWHMDCYWTDRGDMDAPRLTWQPTHWRPLPTPPGGVK